MHNTVWRSSAEIASHVARHLTSACYRNCLLGKVSEDRKTEKLESNPRAVPQQNLCDMAAPWMINFYISVCRHHLIAKLSSKHIYDMQRLDIYGRLNMKEFYWGDVFDLITSDQDISTEEARLRLLDKACVIENLKALGTGWNQVTYDQAKALLTKALTYDLAYSSTRIAPDDKVQFFKAEILKDIDDQSIYCFTNWLGSPWDGERGGGWNPLTTHTFDMGIVFLTQTKLTFAYFISED